MKQKIAHGDRARPDEAVPSRRLNSVQALSREAEIARLSARVEELERECDEAKEFVAMAAHELLKPLIMTEAAATLVSERAGYALDLDSRRNLDVLMRDSARVRRVVEALLMDASDARAPLNPQAVDLGEVVEDCVGMLGEEIRSRQVHVEVDPMPVVPGNAALLSSVFSNLLANALKYGPREGGDIHVSASRSEAGWTFDVHSRGPKIREQDRQRIFEPWQRGSAERRATGFGLGLAVVRQIVERHGGQVGVRLASEGSGNRFYFTIPA